MSDFSLMDAIESGIVKLPRVPVAQNIPGGEMPIYRELWQHIGKEMPRAGRSKGAVLDPLKLPILLMTALEALYGHYDETFRLWQEKRISIPPCFIIVCQNTAVSKLVYDYVSGFYRKLADGSEQLENGRLTLFRNFDDSTGNPLPRPNTLLIDSEELESGDALDDNLRKMAADEIERFRRETVERTGDARAADEITDQELLREVMNTVGKGGTYPALLMYEELADEACSLIASGITDATALKTGIKVLLDPFNPVGSTMHVRFNTSKPDRWDTKGPPARNHVNWVVLDSDWEAEFCRVAEGHPRVVAYTKNHNLGFEVPYRLASEARRYRPDFIVLVDDGRGKEDLLHLVVETKGYRGEDAKAKKLAMDSYWIPGVNASKAHGRWAFIELTDVFQIESEFDKFLSQAAL